MGSLSFLNSITTSLDNYRHVAFKRAIDRTSFSSTFQLASLLPTSAAEQHSYRTYHTVQEWSDNCLPPQNGDGSCEVALWSQSKQTKLLRPKPYYT